MSHGLLGDLLCSSHRRALVPHGRQSCSRGFLAGGVWVGVIHAMTKSTLQEPFCGFITSVTSLCQQIQMRLAL